MVVKEITKTDENLIHQGSIVLKEGKYYLSDVDKKDLEFNPSTKLIEFGLWIRLKRWEKAPILPNPDLVWYLGDE